MRPRRQKRRTPVEEPHAPPCKQSNEDQEDDEEEEISGPPARRRKYGPSNIRIQGQHVPGQGEEEEIPSDEVIESMIAFCCQNCNCSQERRAHVANDEYIHPDEVSLWHRRCCHGILRQDQIHGWLPPFDMAAAKAETALLTGENVSIEERLVVSKEELRQKYRVVAKRMESEIHNEDEMECK